MSRWLLIAAWIVGGLSLVFLLTPEHVCFIIGAPSIGEGTWIGGASFGVWLSGLVFLAARFRPLKPLQQDSRQAE